MEHYLDELSGFGSTSLDLFGHHVLHHMSVSISIYIYTVILTVIYIYIYAYIYIHGVTYIIYIYNYYNCINVSLHILQSVNSKGNPP